MSSIAIIPTPIAIIPVATAATAPALFWACVFFENSSIPIIRNVINFFCIF